MGKEQKQAQVKELREEFKKAKVIGVIDLESLPSKQLQKIKKSINKNVQLKIAKKNVLERALEGDTGKLITPKIRMPAIILTNDNPFKLFKTLKQKQSPTFAKPGQEAPIDITIPAGPTDFGPGPMISEFGAMGIKTKIDKGKIAIQNDTVVVKKGETISAQKASFLQKMGVKPVKIGINLVAVYEDGIIFGKDVLDVDEEQIKQSITLASQHAFNLSVEAGVYTKDNITIFINKASSNARNLGLEANIYSKELIGEILQKAHNQANNLR